MENNGAQGFTFTVRTILTGLLIMLFSACQDMADTPQPKSLSISKNGRYLVDSRGNPFLYLGDTAWELFHKLNKEEAKKYLENRADKGFNVVQAVVLAELDGLRKPNAYGHLPLKNLDPATPNEAYFKHVDFIVDYANKLGLFVGMLPTWGDKLPSAHPGAGPVIFNHENAYVYGRFLGERYRNDSIIWILGGDRNPLNDSVMELWRSMARGLQEGDRQRHLITYHPRGGAQSYFWFQHDTLIDFNAYQSGHGKRFNNVFQYAQTNYCLEPTKPFIDLEPAYEDIPVRFWEFIKWDENPRVPKEILDSNNLVVEHENHFKNGWFNAYDIRVHNYWNMLAGACGVVYGNNGIWQMNRKKDPLVIPCKYNWVNALDRPGAKDIKHLRYLFSKRSFAKLIPDQSLIYGFNNAVFGSNYIAAAIGQDRRFIIAYLPMGDPVQICLEKLYGDKVSAKWFNPATGQFIAIEGEQKPKIREFVPPAEKGNKDWVLVIDSKALQNDLPLLR